MGSKGRVGKHAQIEKILFIRHGVICNDHRLGINIRLYSRQFNSLYTIHAYEIVKPLKFLFA